MGVVGKIGEKGGKRENRERERVWVKKGEEQLEWKGGVGPKTHRNNRNWTI